MSIKVGTLCVIVDAGWHADLNGKECIVIGGLQERRGMDAHGNISVGIKYRIEVQGEKEIYQCFPHQIKPKRPKDEKFEEFMKHVLKPVEIRDVEIVK